MCEGSSSHIWCLGRRRWTPFLKLHNLAPMGSCFRQATHHTASSSGPDPGLLWCIILTSGLLGLKELPGAPQAMLESMQTCEQKT